MERAPCSREWVAAEVHRLESPTDPDPVQPAAPDAATLRPASRRRRDRFGEFVERFLEAIANSSVQPAGLGPRGFRGRFH
jgi:hypothetical protein